MNQEEAQAAIEKLDRAYRKRDKSKRLALILGFVLTFAVGFLAGASYQYYATERITIISPGPSIDV